jgi:hypothetical protein
MQQYRCQPQQSGLEFGADGRTIWIADAHRGDGKRFVVSADEKLTAFLELETVTRESLRLPSTGQRYAQHPD